MTSNMGASIIQDRFEKVNEKNEWEIFEQTKEDVMQLLRSSMRPEFLNRIDEIIMFTPLSKKHLEAIIKIQLHHLSEKLIKQNIQLQLTPDALDYIMEKGYDPAMGARPVKRVIQKDVMTALSKAILSGKIVKEEPMVMDVFDGQVVFRSPLPEEMLIQI